jgi:hypothetical protein
MTHVEKLTETATRIFRKHGISTAVRPHNTLRKILVHPKDKRDPSTTTDCIYEIPCGNCESTYVGETGHRFETRLKEHKKETEKVVGSRGNYTRLTKKQSSNEQSKSAIADHATQQNHVINWDDAKVLTTECDLYARHVKEAIWIRRRAPNTMNRDEGPIFLVTYMILFWALVRPLLVTSQLEGSWIIHHHSDDDYRPRWSKLSG